MVEVLPYSIAYGFAEKKDAWALRKEHTQALFSKLGTCVYNVTLLIPLSELGVSFGFTTAPSVLEGISFIVCAVFATIFIAFSYVELTVKESLHELKWIRDPHHMQALEYQHTARHTAKCVSYGSLVMFGVVAYSLLSCLLEKEKTV